jgi:hypothetical protein
MTAYRGPHFCMTEAQEDFSMLDALFANYLLVAILIIVIWVGSLGFYLYASNQHQSVEGELDKLDQLLDEDHRNK